ncbi:MAG: orotate phosphoribosyltransferase [Armatimonadota bacterium]
MADLIGAMEGAGAILRGHFLLSSGRHSDVYFEKFRILERPALLSQACAEIAKSVEDSAVDLVAGPTTGGVIIAFEVARQMGVHALYVEREGERRVLRRGAHLPRGSRVLVVDDVLTTGLSVREVMSLLRDAGGEIVGVGVLVDRSEEPVEYGVPLFAAARVHAKSYAPDEVPDWLAEIPITDPGSRRLNTGT